MTTKKREVTLYSSGTKASFPFSPSEGVFEVERVPWSVIQVAPGVFIYAAVSKETNRVAILNYGWERK